MKPLDLPAGSRGLLEVRKAEIGDRDILSNLIAFESHVHKHLDWKAPLEWLGQQPFLVLLEGQRITGALACAVDPVPIAWLRLFVFPSHLSGSATWELLWSEAMRQLRSMGGAMAAAIATQRWLDPILLENGFKLVNHIVLMEMDIGSAHASPAHTNPRIRRMQAEDLPRVVEVDAAAFEPLWRNSLPALTNAFGQASYATVAENGSSLLGYQLSTGGAFGTHLARLAVLPAAQGQGLGADLVNDLIHHIPTHRERRLTVNTQSDNAASHALYERLGFRRTGERFPVFALEIPADNAPAHSPGGGL